MYADATRTTAVSSASRRRVQRQGPAGSAARSAAAAAARPARSLYYHTRALVRTRARARACAHTRQGAARPEDRARSTTRSSRSSRSPRARRAPRRSRRRGRTLRIGRTQAPCPLATRLKREAVPFPQSYAERRGGDVRPISGTALHARHACHNMVRGGGKGGCDWLRLARAPCSKASLAVAVSPSL